MPFGIGKFNNSSNFDKGLSKNIGGGSLSESLKVLEEVIKTVRLDFITLILCGRDGVKDMNYIH